MNGTNQASHRRGFTLVELLLVVGLIAVIMVVVFSVLNPQQEIAQSRDAIRVSDLKTIETSLNLYARDNQQCVLGTPGVEYLSLIDPAATSSAGGDCSSLGFPADGTYHCAASSSVYNVDGTGWIPVNFSQMSGGAPFSKLPVDPVNTSSSGEYYVYVTNGSAAKLEAYPESQKYAPLATGDGGSDPAAIESGSTQIACANRVPFSYSLTFSTTRTGAEFDAAGNLYLGYNNTVQKWVPSGNSFAYGTAFGSGGSGNGQFSNVGAMAFDGSGNLLVIDQFNSRVEKWTPSGTTYVYATAFGTSGSGVGQLYLPTDLLFDGSGNLYIADPHNNRVEKWVPNGGTYVYNDTYNDPLYGLPESIKFDASGNLYMMENGKDEIEKWVPNGNSFSYSSVFGSTGSGIGQINFPNDIAFDAAGNLYIADNQNHRVDKWVPSGGTFVFGASFANNGGATQFLPAQLSFDAAGNLYVYNQKNGTMQKWVPSGF
ncbi:MAG TPA: NHL repeat-containing protein [Candidatus Paceibacterota bacterium]|nr:NHL repeat-containing protein [Candidatus Paceibacterota bacterium]